MRRPFGGILAIAALPLLGACAVGVIPIPIPLGTKTVPAGDATPPGPDGTEGDL